MKNQILLLIIFPISAIGSQIPPAPTPVFLKAGFSSVLEFDQTPTRVVLGDSRNFQVERVDQSLVVRTLAPYAVTNMFVYFKDADAKLFVLTASEDAEPSYLQKFQTKLPKLPVETQTKATAPIKAGARVLRKEWDPKKDYLVIGVELSAGSTEALLPIWDHIRLHHPKGMIAPFKLWAERQDVQKDSRIRARLIFAKPNVPRDLKGVNVVIPIKGKANAISVAL